MVLIVLQARLIVDHIIYSTLYANRSKPYLEAYVGWPLEQVVVKQERVCIILQPLLIKLVMPF